MEDQEMGGLLMALSKEPGEELTKLQIISVYALSGTTPPPPQTLQITGFIKRLPISFLKNCGSTHNFISETIAKWPGLSVIDATLFLAGIADGNQMTSARTYQFSLITQGHVFYVTISHLALKGFDVVLGCDYHSQAIIVDLSKTMPRLFFL